MTGRRLLFVDAPFGPFFRALVPALEAEGATIRRLVLDGGDLIETPRRCRLRVPREIEFGAFLDRTLERNRIDTVVTFGHAMPRHASAQNAAGRHGIRLIVLENGLLRPHHVTVEGGGPVGRQDEHRFRDALGQTVRSTTRHFLAAELLRPFLPYDRSAYGASVPRQAIGYVREGVARLRFEPIPFQDQRKADGRIVLALLQKPGDSQIRLRSPFRDVGASLVAMLRSFAADAPAETRLVVKQHPLDPGTEQLARVLAREAGALGLTDDRVTYRRSMPLDIAFAQADAVVTVNSSAGLQALSRGLPVKCLGEAAYARPGLADPQPLSSFWSAPTPPDPCAVAAFRDELATTTQMSGGFHSAPARAILVPALARYLVRSR